MVQGMWMRLQNGWSRRPGLPALMAAMVVALLVGTAAISAADPWPGSGSAGPGSSGPGPTGPPTTDVPPRPSEPTKIIPKPETVVTKPEQVRSVTGTPSGTQTTVLTAGTRVPAVGGYLVAEASTGAPDGLLGAITAVTTNPDGTTTVTTRPATSIRRIQILSSTMTTAQHRTPDRPSQPYPTPMMCARQISSAR